MGDDNYVKELRAGVVGAKLPTLIDLSPHSEHNLDNRIETPTTINYAMKEGTAATAMPKKTKEDLSMEISVKAKRLHSQGRRIDEIYEILQDEGYAYGDIEPIIMDILSRNKPSPAQQQAPPQQTQPRFASQQAQRPPQAPMPQRQFSPQAQNFPPRTSAVNPVMGAPVMQRRPQPEENMEVVELQSVSRSFDQPPEEAPVAQMAEAPVAEQQQPMLENEFAPLFVRVGKYRETLETLNDLENYLKAMTRLFELVEELEKIRAINIEVLDRMHKKALATSEKLSSGLLKPRGMQVEGTRESDVELSKLGDIIGDLSKELSMLKGEVDKLSRIE